MDDKCYNRTCWGADLEWVRCGAVTCTHKVHNPASTTAGQVGSSALLVARSEGNQQLDPTGSQLGSLVTRTESNRYSCGACTLCEIMEQDRDIALLATEAAIYL